MEQNFCLRHQKKIITDKSFLLAFVVVPRRHVDLLMERFNFTFFLYPICGAMREED